MTPPTAAVATFVEPGTLIQFLKYAVAGAIATGVHILIFNLFAWKVFPALQEKDLAVKFLGLCGSKLTDAVRSRNAMIDNACAFILAGWVAYLINIFWVFERGRHNIFVEIGLFYGISGISFFIGTAAMGFLIRRFGIQTTLAFCANIVSALLINFAARKYFIFKG